MVELVWDSGRAGTVLTPSGAIATVGDSGMFTPEDLICMAAAGCLMQNFLTRVERTHLNVLSYASTARLQHEGPDAPRIHLKVYIVSAHTDESLIHEACRRCLETSPIARLLGDRLAVTCDVRIIRDAPVVVH
jgi:organic hydroperoxide reductase OsmC/OhrA